MGNYCKVCGNRISPEESIKCEKKIERLESKEKLWIVKHLINEVVNHMIILQRHEVSDLTTINSDLFNVLLNWDDILIDK